MTTPSSATLALLTAMMLACGPGSPTTDGDPPPTAEWAYGWWMSDGGLLDHPEWGSYIQQFEVRPDGTVVQMIDYCKGEAADWYYEARWELQADGTVRVLPPVGEDLLSFASPYNSYNGYVDLRPGDDSCALRATYVSSVDGSEYQTIGFERGRWCNGAYLPEFDECELSKYCGEEPPVCE